MGLVRLESFGRGIRRGASSHTTSRWPTGRKRCRAIAKKNEEQKAKDLETQAAQPPTSGLVVALNAMPRAEEPPSPQSPNDLMDHTL